MLLAGIGHVDNQQKKNFLIVDASESHFHKSMVQDETDTWQRRRRT